MKKAITISRDDLFEDTATGYVYRVLGRRGRTSEFDCECTDEYDEESEAFVVRLRGGKQLEFGGECE